MKALVILFSFCCSCATVMSKKDLTIKDIQFISSFDTICFREEIIVKQLSDNIYEATCSANGHKANYSILGKEIIRIR